jgi:hypothetical protein
LPPADVTAAAAPAIMDCAARMVSTIAVASNVSAMGRIMRRRIP